MTWRTRCDGVLGTRAAREGERTPLVECTEVEGNNESAICTRVDQTPRGNGVNKSPEAARVGAHPSVGPAVDNTDYVIVSQSGNYVNIQELWDFRELSKYLA